MLKINCDYVYVDETRFFIIIKLWHKTTNTAFFDRATFTWRGGTRLWWSLNFLIRGTSTWQFPSCTTGGGRTHGCRCRRNSLWWPLDWGHLQQKFFMANILQLCLLLKLTDLRLNNKINNPFITHVRTTNFQNWPKKKLIHLNSTVSFSMIFW